MSGDESGMDPERPETDPERGGTRSGARERRERPADRVPDGRLHGDLPVVDAETAAGRVPADGTVLVSGFGSVGYPKAVPLALAAGDRDLSLTVVSGGSVGEELDDALVEAGAVARRYPFQASGPMRTAVNDGRVAFADRGVAGVADDVLYGGLVDTDGAVAVVEAVAVGEDWLVPSTSVGQTPAFVAAADRLVVECNRAQPLALAALHDVYRPGRPPDRAPVPLRRPDGRIGDPRVRFDPRKLAAVVETDRPDSPYAFRASTDDDRAVVDNLRAFLEREVERSPAFEDRLVLQFGMGSVGNALMGALPDLQVGDRTVEYFGEVIQDGLLDAVDAGAVAGASATSLALTEAGQRRLFDDIERYAESVVVRPTDVSNGPALIDRFGVVAVNSALEVDLYGHANSTHVGGTDLVNGIGGAADFARNALVSVCALPSTLGGDGDGEDGDGADGDGCLRSRIVPMVPHVDATEHDLDVVVTEWGVADLRGLSPVERAERVLECAHPDVRPSLRAYLADARAGGGHLPHDLDRAFDWR